MFAEEGARILASDLSPAAAQEIEALAPGAITYVAAGDTDKHVQFSTALNFHGTMLADPDAHTTTMP